MKKNFVYQIIVSIMILSLSMLLFACKEDEIVTPVEVKYNVVFDVNAGDALVNNEPDIMRVVSGSNASKPTPDPSRNGFDFIGWYLNEAGSGEAYQFNTPITANLVLYAKWSVTIQYYTVTIVYANGDANETEQIVSGQMMNEPTEPLRVGYHFEGWYIDELLSSKYNFANEVTSNFTLYAKWIQMFTITFDLNYEGSAAPTSQTLLLGDVAEEPEILDRVNYTFAGWFKDTGFTLPYEFDAVSSSVTVYAKWIEDSTATMFTVEFIYGYEGSPSNVIRTVAEGAMVNQPTTTRENYRFLGWYLDQGTFQNRYFTSTTPITQNLVLYANYVRTYQLNVDYNYSSAINPNPRTVDVGVEITIPQTPSRIGYTFAGWSNSSSGTIGYNFTTGITTNTTVYAQWTKTNVFEAEYLDFRDFFGWGFSGNATGTDAIVADLGGAANASNGRFVNYLYGNGITLTFDIYSDRAVSGVVLTLRLSGEIKDFYIQSQKTIGVLEPEPVYTIKVNNQTIIYPNISFEDVPAQSSNTLLPFQDFVISMTINLVEGKNEIKLITDNELSMGGTMSATAPMVDCLKLTTYAILTWTPKLDNY